MNEVTLPIKALFEIISMYEKVNFLPEQEQYLNSELKIKDEFGQWVLVNAAITKETVGRKIKFDNGETIAAADKHLIHDGEDCVYFNSLSVDDILIKSTGEEVSVVEITPIDDTLFYDLSVVSDSHLYQTANGFVHHNTELARLLSQHLDMPLLKYDMSEYAEKHTVAGFIGSPPGYVGYGEGTAGAGRLVTDIIKNPHSILLFDEVEKAHPDIFNVFLQLLDDGKITGSGGKVANAKNTIIILTSNLGSRDNERNVIGFGNPERTGEDDKALKEFFKPEFRNRISLVCKFNKLDKLSIKRIVNKFTSSLSHTLKETHGLSLLLSEDVVDFLAEQGYDPKMGARPLERKIDELIRVPLSKRILFERLKNATIHVNLIDGKIEFDISSKVEAHLNEDGIITLS